MHDRFLMSTPPQDAIYALLTEQIVVYMSEAPVVML